jgi:hypothetical protein
MGYPQQEPNPGSYAPRVNNDQLDPRRSVSSVPYTTMNANAPYQYPYGNGGPYGDIRLPDAPMPVENSLDMGQPGAPYYHRVAYPGESTSAQAKPSWSAAITVQPATAQSPLSWNGSPSRTLPTLSEAHHQQSGRWMSDPNSRHGPIQLAALNAPAQHRAGTTCRKEPPCQLLAHRDPQGMATRQTETDGANIDEIIE